MRDFYIIVLYGYNIISILILFMFLIGKLNLMITKVNKDTGEEQEVSTVFKYLLMILLSYGWLIIPFVNEISKLGRRHRKNNEKED